MTLLREEFRAHRCVRVPSFIEERLLLRIQAQIAGAALADRAHGRISTELCMERNACLGLLNFLVNDPAVFRFVEQVSSGDGLRSFVGRVYRLLAEREQDSVVARRETQKVSTGVRRVVSGRGNRP